MIVKLFPDKAMLGQQAARHAAQGLRKVLAERDRARLVAATGASQFEFLEALTACSDIDWRRVEMFHLDEYVGLPIDHPASFRKYLIERLVRKTGIERVCLLDGEGDIDEVLERSGRLLSASPIDLAFVGIGENGHLAFNDPPADFETEQPYIVVELDEACRMQQVREGWFESVDKVPTRAISMSVRQILKAEEILCIVPDARKAAAVKACLEGPISSQAPASILRTHPMTTLFLDPGSASLLNPIPLREGR